MIYRLQLFRGNHYDLQLFSAILFLQLMVLINKIHRGLINVVFVSMHVQASSAASVNLNSRVTDILLRLHNCFFYFL